MNKWNKNPKWSVAEQGPISTAFNTSDDSVEVPILIAWSHDLKFWKEFPLPGTYYLKGVPHGEIKLLNSKYDGNTFWISEGESIKSSEVAENTEDVRQHTQA